MPRVAPTGTQTEGAISREKFHCQWEYGATCSDTISCQKTKQGARNENYQI